MSKDKSPLRSHLFCLPELYNERRNFQAMTLNNHNLGSSGPFIQTRRMISPPFFLLLFWAIPTILCSWTFKLCQSLHGWDLGEVGIIFWTGSILANDFPDLLFWVLRIQEILIFIYSENFDLQQMYNPANLMLIWNNSAEIMQDKFNFLNYLINLVILV